MKRFLWLGFVLSLYVICTGCGDTFRPIIIPNPPVFPNPRAAHTVVAINDNAPPVNQTEVAVGSAMVIDVSGDTEVSIANVGLAPVHAVQQTSNQVLVVNHSVLQNTGDSLTQLTFFGTTINSASTISLPPNSAPNFVATAPSSRTAYVTLPTYVDPTTNTVVPSVGVVSTLTDSLTATIPVGNNPYALAVTPDNSKLYVANKGDNTISGFNTLDLSARLICVNTVCPVPPGNAAIPLSSAPIWSSPRTDNQRVFVLEASGILASLDTTATAGPDLLTEYPAISVPGATTMVYDANENRLYVPGGQQIGIVDVSQSNPQFLAGGPIAILAVAPSSRSATDPCSLTSAQTLTVAAAAALPDGSRAYVGAYYVDASDNVCPQVTVIDAVSNTVKSSTAVLGFPDATNPSSLYYVPVCATTRFRFMMAAGGDSTRAYLSSCDGGNVNVIDTTTDTYILNLQAPIGVRPPILQNPLNPPQNPVFLIAGP